MSHYQREAQYHETDQMGCIHHANYIKWFEEARTFWLKEHGISYKDFEKEGIYSPVSDMHVYYNRPVFYNDTVEIEVQITEYTGIKFVAEYTVRDILTKEIKCTGHSKHCFVDKEGKILSIKRLNHPTHEIMLKYSIKKD